MGLINLGAGLAAMGQGISNFGSQMGLLYEKEQMKEGMVKLASQLQYQTQSKLQGQSETFQSGQQTQRLGVEKGIAQGQEQTTLKAARVGAASRRAEASIYAGAQENVARQNILANGNHLTFGQDGQAVIVNTVTHSTTPLTGSDGKPVRIQNPEMYKFASSIYAYNAQQAMLINDETQASLAATKAEMDQKSSTLPAKLSVQAMSEALKPYTDRMAAIEKDGQNRINALNQQTGGVIQSIASGTFFAQGNTGSGSPSVVPSGAPPLSSFKKPLTPYPSGSGQ